MWIHQQDLLHGAFWRTALVLGMRGATKIIPVQEVSGFGDGEVLDVPGAPRVVHAPGHTGGSAAILLEDRGILFTGDVLCTHNAYTGRVGPQIMPSGLNAGPPGLHDVAPARPWLEHRVARANTTGRKGRNGCPHARPRMARRPRVVAAGAIRTAGHDTLGRRGRALAGAGVSTFGGPARYEIRVAGVPDSRRAAWFNGLHISGQAEETVICGLVADQSALHSLLTKVRDSGSA